MEKVKSQILNSNLFISGEDFTVSEMVTRTRSTRGTVERVLKELLKDHIICEEINSNKRHYKRRSVHWIHKQKLANYRPPREAKYQFHSEWLNL